VEIGSISTLYAVAGQGCPLGMAGRRLVWNDGGERVCAPGLSFERLGPRSGTIGWPDDPMGSDHAEAGRHHTGPVMKIEG
jgi:hypothetical protein